jgi:GNAT superfamily N-acetyltransferase
MNLELAIVVSCTETGCCARLLGEDSDIDTVYSRGILRYQIEVLPGDLVAIDRAADPPQTCFCWALATVKRVETRVYTDRQTASQSPVEGLTDPITAGDRVFGTGDQVYDLCINGLPAHPDLLRSKTLPEIEAMLQALAPDQAAPPEVASTDDLPARTQSAGAPQTVEYLTAETERGKQAIREVMQHSYTADLDATPPAWAIARLVAGIPVSFILIVPDKEMDLGNGVRYAFVNDVATREDRRLEGHFRALMEHAYGRVRQAGMSLLLLHGRYPLYRRLGFDVFTHHSGITITPEPAAWGSTCSRTTAGLPSRPSK